MSLSATNSRTSRVQPVFGWLAKHGGDDWPDQFLRLASGIDRTDSCGKYKAIWLDPEREVPASSTRLAWMLRNVPRLAPVDGRRWQELQKRTQDGKKVQEALAELDRGNLKRLSRGLCLEGKTHADCLIECERALIWIEGKRFDWLSPSVTWDVSRDQLARNLEAVWILAAAEKKDYCLIICHEHPLKHHEQALVTGYRNCTWDAGWPHLPAEQRKQFSKRIGTVTWQKIAAEWPSLRDLPKLSDLTCPTV